MKIDFEIDLTKLDDGPTKDGQISVKIPKDQERRFKSLNAKYDKQLSAWMRDFALRLMDKVEKRDSAA